MKADEETRRSSAEIIIAANDEDLHAYVVELCKEHLKNYPSDGYIWHQYACILTELSRFDEANNALEQALNFSEQKSHDTIFVSLGEVHFDRANYLKAEKYFLKASALSPNETYIISYLGICAFRQGELQLAEKYFRRALRCEDDPDGCKEEVLFNLGGVLVALERYNEATECYNRTSALGNESAKLRLRDIEEIRKLKARN